MKFIKHHWFNILMVLFILVSMGQTLLVAFSPREDKQNRGFIPCTKQLSMQLIECQSGAWCVIKAVMKNSGCDLKVIGQGLSLWVKGEQSTPWSNYLYQPDLSHLENNLNENSKLFYKENPNYLEDFEQVKQEHQKLEESNSNEQTEN